ncbi:amidohydrolase family protein [Spirosoma aerolatum]|uniref:amidohydrolase family protein n=1 Tax=Spirosoma aerolatum TaxID=1211326 RepID=UPI0009AC6345|nr:amidohydrolase family protein [Spirosoma aerolatum]
MLVVPGFNKAHNHLPSGLKSVRISLAGMDPSWETVQDSLRKVEGRTPESQWIEATIGPSIANSPEATRFVLDKIAPNHPVRLLSWWGHVGLYNSLGLREMGIAEDQPDPKGGFYERVTNGKTLTGKGCEKNAYLASHQLCKNGPIARREHYGR